MKMFFSAPSTISHFYDVTTVDFMTSALNRERENFSWNLQIKFSRSFIKVFIYISHFHVKQHPKVYLTINFRRISHIIMSVKLFNLYKKKIFFTILNFPHRNPPSIEMQLKMEIESESSFSSLSRTNELAFPRINWTCADEKCQRWEGKDLSTSIPMKMKLFVKLDRMLWYDMTLRLSRESMLSVITAIFQHNTRSNMPRRHCVVTCSKPFL